MVFVVGAVCGAVVTVGARRPAFAGSEAYLLARHIIAQIFGVYALRMAGVFLISQATLWMRTAVMPRWLSIVTYVIALVLLLTFTSSRWIVLVFPAWVFGVSLYILILHLRRSAGGDAAKDSTSG